MSCSRKTLRSVAYPLILLILTIFCKGCQSVDKSKETASVRERTSDRIVHLEDEIVREIPNPPPLCDSLPHLEKQLMKIEDGERSIRTCGCSRSQACRPQSRRLLRPLASPSPAS